MKYVLAATVAVFLFTGCGMVPRNQNWVRKSMAPGSPISREQISIIRCAEPLLINYLDNVRTRYDFNSNAKMEYVVEPGNHRVVVVFGRPWDNSVSDPAIFEISLNPGQVIEFREEHKTEWGSTKWRTYMVDITDEYWGSKQVPFQ